MKKLVLTAVCVLGMITASAQRASSTSTSFFSTEKADQDVTIGIRAGLNFTNMTGDIDENYGMRTAYHVGVIADIPLMQSLYIQTGLYLQNKGTKLDYEEDGYYEKDTYSPMYLQIPILASYRYNFSDAMQLQVNFGPYFAYGIGGKDKYEYGYDGEVEEKFEYDVFGDEGEFKRFDCGLQVGAGLTFARHYYIGFTYEFGLTNIADAEDDDFNVKNNNFMLSVGYNF